MKKLTLLLLLLLVLSLAACAGGGEEKAAAGDATAGERVFHEVAAPACGTCHSLEPGVAGAGPSLAGIAAQAGSRVTGMSAEDYLRQAIIDPNADIAEGFAANVMTATYGSQLTEQQIADLVAYLMTLK
jgi:cytochrome c553